MKKKSSPLTTATPRGTPPRLAPELKATLGKGPLGTEAKDSKIKAKKVTLRPCGDRWGGGTNPPG